MGIMLSQKRSWRLGINAPSVRYKSALIVAKMLPAIASCEVSMCLK